MFGALLLSRVALHVARLFFCLSQKPTDSIHDTVGSADDEEVEGILNELFPENDQLTMAHFIEVYKILDGILNDTSVDE